MTVFAEPVSDGATEGVSGADALDGDESDAPVVESATHAMSIGAQYLGQMPSTRGNDGFVAIADSDFQIRGGTASSALDAKDGDFFFDGAILHIQSSKPLAVRTTPVPVPDKEGEFTPKQTANTIQIDPGVKADLTLAGVDISTTGTPLNVVTNKWDTSDKSAAKVPADIKNRTMLHLTLADDSVNTLACTVKSVGGKGSPGLRCGYGSVLVIDDELRNLDEANQIVTPVHGVVGSDVKLIGGKTIAAGSPLSTMDSADPGTLNAMNGAHSACIGGGPKEDSGTIIVNGGIINAHGDTTNANYNTGAGIGGGDGGSGTVIIVNGGIINAEAPFHGAGIGAGWGWTNPGDIAHADALTIPTNPENNGYTQFGGPYGSSYYHNVGGDITINGGFIVAHAGGHGNAFGQACGGTPSSNKNHIMRITGGTLLPYGMVDRFSMA